MKWSKPKRITPFSQTTVRTGRKNGYIAKIYHKEDFSGKERDYFYFLTNKNDKAYNSLWDGLSYETETECMKACEAYCKKGDD